MRLSHNLKYFSVVDKPANIVSWREDLKFQLQNQIRKKTLKRNRLLSAHCAHCAHCAQPQL